MCGIAGVRSASIDRDYPRLVAAAMTRRLAHRGPDDSGMWTEPWRGVAFGHRRLDRKSTRLNSSHGYISYAVFCLKKKKKNIRRRQGLISHPGMELHDNTGSEDAARLLTRPRRCVSVLPICDA